MKEIELKFKLNEDIKNFYNSKLNLIYSRLQERIILQERTRETTTMYDNKDMFMQKTDGRLRIRAGYKNSLSYKKPLTRKGIKEEIEFETEIKDIKQAELILQELGYKKVSGYTRYRTIWKYENVKIFIDEFSFGNYIEIEGNKKDIIKFAKLLGFKTKDNITKSYDGIYKEHCINNKIRFKAFFK